VDAWVLCMTVYADLQVTTHFSFLRGASSPAELFEQAKLLGIAALGVTDRNSLAGIVRAYEASRETGVRLVVGCRLDLTDGTSLLVYPTDRPAYSRLCRLLSLGKSWGGKGKCFLTWGYQTGLVRSTAHTSEPCCRRDQSCRGPGTGSCLGTCLHVAQGATRGPINVLNPLGGNDSHQ
jgi:DNA polymerase III alpha subunit